MKQFWTRISLLILLLLVLLLAGYWAVSQTLFSKAPGESEPTTLPTEPAGTPLLNQGESVDSSGNFMYIPNSYVESMACPEIRLYENSLLLYEHTMSGKLHMKRVSLEDGRLLAEASYSVSPSVRIQVGNGSVALSDSDSGQVLILNGALELEKTYSVPMQGESWCLNQELETLYIFFSDKGLLCWDLTTGQSRWLLENAAFTKSFGVSGGYVLLSYTDRADQKTYIRSLNLSTATLETVPIDGLIISGVRSGEQWLLRQNYESGKYILIDQDTSGTFVWPEGLVELLSGRRQLLVVDDTYRNYYLYDLDGDFVSKCNLPQIEYASAGTDLVWSDYWQGYFFRDTYENSAHLMFWNTDIAQEGENISITPLETVQPSEPVMEQALYQRAAELSKRFGVNIRIGEQCALDYSHYEATILKNPTLVRAALNVLERTLSAYPEGFFQKLCHGDIQEIRIELATYLRTKEEINTHPESANGFVQSMPSYYLLVLEGTGLSDRTVYHEVSHMIDKRLEWDAMLRPDALYSEETWLSLQPDGFQYAESYTNMPPSTQAFENSGYFVSSYAMTFPTEDRATLMALAMTNSTLIEENIGMMNKMRYYAACIRDCFGTSGWPETTVWEQVLK